MEVPGVFLGIEHQFRVELKLGDRVRHLFADLVLDEVYGPDFAPLLELLFGYGRMLRQLFLHYLRDQVLLLKFVDHCLVPRVRSWTYNDLNLFLTYFVDPF